MNQNLEKAYRSLASAKLLYKDKDIDGAINRAYYAMFAAASFAISDHDIKGVSIKTHTGLRQHFSNIFVKTGVMPQEIAKALTKVEELRMLADYQSNAVISDEICIKAMSDAEKFVKFIDDLHIESNESPDIDVLQSKNFNDPSMN